MLAGIAAQPDDDTLRKVMADWLRDRGHDDRASLIQAQIAEVREPDPQIRDEANRVANRLVQQMWGAVDPWPDCRPLAGVAPRSDPFDDPFEECELRVVWDRGFVAVIEADWPTWQQIGPLMVPLHPVARVDLPIYSCESLDSDSRTVRHRWVRGRSRQHEREQCLPSELFDHLPHGVGEKLLDRHGEPIVPGIIRYRTVAQGRAALSAAALSWAKTCTSRTN